MHHYCGAEVIQKHSQREMGITIWMLREARQQRDSLNQDIVGERRCAVKLGRVFAYCPLL